MNDTDKELWELYKVFLGNFGSSVDLETATLRAKEALISARGALEVWRTR